jgi:hypothetical protein
MEKYIFYSILYRTLHFFQHHALICPLVLRQLVVITQIVFVNWLPGGTTSVGTAFKKQTVAVSLGGGGGGFGTLLNYKKGGLGKI